MKTTQKTSCESARTIEQALNSSFPAPQLYTWGSGYHGQLALGTRQVQPTPTIVSKLLTTQQFVRQVWCGSHHCAAVTTDGELYTWGANKTGCLGRVLPGTCSAVCAHSVWLGARCCGPKNSDIRLAYTSMYTSRIITTGKPPPLSMGGHTMVSIGNSRVDFRLFLRGN